MKIINNVEDIRQVLYIAECGEGISVGKQLKKLCAVFSDINLGCEDNYNDSVALIVEILSTPELFNKRGIGHFATEISMSFFSMNDFQKKDILKAIVKHCHLYTNLNFCDILGGMIGHECSIENALGIFKEILSFNCDEIISNGAVNIVGMGLYELKRRSGYDVKLINEIEKIERIVAGKSS